MDFSFIIFLLTCGAFVYAFIFIRRVNQVKYIEQFRFNSAIGKKVKRHYPHLTDSQVSLVLDALRDYFYICHKANRRLVAMPSQVVDVAWHEFILFTRAYQGFCRKAFGRFLHHTPTQAMRSPTQAQAGIKRAWRIACHRAKINPQSPLRLPLIFEIDALLGIEDGFTYSLNCKDPSSSSSGDFCASHIGCAAGCAGGGSGSSNDGFGSSDAGSSDGSGCGGGD